MTAQILAAVIFVGMFALIIMDKFERQYVTLGSAALVLVVVFGICMHSWDAIKNALNLGAIFRADFWYGASESASSGVNNIAAPPCRAASARRRMADVLPAMSPTTGLN